MILDVISDFFASSFMEGVTWFLVYLVLAGMVFLALLDIIKWFGRSR